MPEQGIALTYPYYEDLQVTGSTWWYVWGPCPLDAPPGCVPMSWAGADPNLPIDYNDYVILFNEPDRPDQANLSPAIALVRYKELVQMYPRVKWVVGNTW